MVRKKRKRITVAWKMLLLTSRFPPSLVVSVQSESVISLSLTIVGSDFFASNSDTTNIQLIFNHQKKKSL